MKLRQLLLIISVSVLSSLVTLSVIKVTSAHNGNTNLIHGCVKGGLLGNGSLRIIDANGTCNNNETPLDWKTYEPNRDFSIVCPRCHFDGLGDVEYLRNKNLTGSYLSNVEMGSSNFFNLNLTNVILTGAQMDGSFYTVNFTGADLTGAYMGQGNYENSNFTSSKLLNVSFSSTNLTNINFTAADLTGATGMEDTIRNNLTWSNTTCPDGTNSNSHGNTCEGHLTP